MLVRALRLAQLDYPFLKWVSVEPHGSFAGLDQTLQEVVPGHAREGLLAVVTCLIDLLVGFVGEELTSRLVVEIWTDLPVPKTSQPHKENGREAASCLPIVPSNPF
jgi:hypothetical protein